MFAGIAVLDGSSSVVADAAGDPYALHQATWDLMTGPWLKNSRDFLFRWERTADGCMRLVFLSKNRPCPDQWSMRKSILSFECSEHEMPHAKNGSVAAFSVVLNPCVKRLNPTTGKSRRVPLSKEQSLEWAAKTLLANGLKTDEGSLRMFGPFKQSFKKKKLVGQESASITISVCQVSGLAEVVNPSLMLFAAKNGIGHGKAFGCGLLCLQLDPWKFCHASSQEGLGNGILSKIAMEDLSDHAWNRIEEMQKQEAGSK